MSILTKFFGFCLLSGRPLFLDMQNIQAVYCLVVHIVHLNYTKCVFCIIGGVWYGVPGVFLFVCGGGESKSRPPTPSYPLAYFFAKKGESVDIYKIMCYSGKAGRGDPSGVDIRRALKYRSKS